MQYKDFLQELALNAGQIIKDKYHGAKKWRAKVGRGDIVTEVDEASEKYLLSRIKQEFPNDSFLSEESGASGVENGKRVWVIDPLDGTRNYMMGIPFFCVSIGVLMYGIPEAGAIYDPIHDEFFYAERGKGAYLNGEKINVSNEESLEDSVISVSWVKHKVDGTRFVEYIRELSKDTSYFRRFGSAALVLSYVACGRVHGYMQAGLSPWDVAAGVLILNEAGGIITDFEGNPIDINKKDIEVVTANPKLHSILLEDVIRHKI